MRDSYLLFSRHLVLPDRVMSGFIHVVGERVAAVIPEGEALPAGEITNVGEAWIFPGIVDTHVHMNEPGRTEWEGFASATAAAAAGGVTTLVDMPLNSDPVTTTPDAFRLKLAAAEGQLAVDVGFYAGLVPGNSAELEPLIGMGVLGVKAFMVDSGIPEFQNVTEKELAEAMPILARHGIPLLAHAERVGPVTLPADDRRSYRRYLASRPSSWEVDAISQLIALCRQTRCPVHVVHLAAAEAVPMLAAARAEGLPITVETCPHYLHFSAEAIPDGRTEFKCAPPIREAAHREALWTALLRGDVDMVVTDHSPCPPAMKCLDEGDFVKAWGGISSIQLGFPVMITECVRRAIPVERLAFWMSEQPARLAGLYPRKGAIVPGADADFAVVRMDHSFTVQARTLRHRHHVTPYLHETLVGVVEKTYLRGHVVYDLQCESSALAGCVVLRV